MPQDYALLGPIPPVASDFANRSINLLERLRQWPKYEMTRDARADDFGRWTQAVQRRHAQGAPRRVLFVHGQLPGETGSGVYLQQIAAESIRKGVDLHVLSAGYHALTAQDLRGVPDERIHTCLFTRSGDTPQPGAVKTPISGMSVVMPYHVLAYRDRTEDELLDWLAIFGGRLAYLAKALQPDIIHVDHLWFLSGLARLVAPWIPLVASAHGTAHKLIVDTPRFRDLVVPCVSSADHVCAISEESVQECIDMFNIPEERITIEGYGFEPELFNWRPVDRHAVLDGTFGLDLRAHRHLVVSVAKFVDWKGLKELALAIGDLRAQGMSIAAVIVGEGDPQSRTDLEGFIVQQKLADAVFLPGKVNRDQLPDIYRCCDLYALPSHVEPFGMVLMEALACGAPAVAANTGGPPHFIPQALRDRDLAMLVDPITLNARGEPQPQARIDYAHRLADGIAAVLHQKAGADDRAAIAEAMLPLSWGRLVDSLASIFNRLHARTLKRRSLS